MAHPLRTPRVNNNDDTVRVVEVSVKAGDWVQRGTVVGAVETDKAVVELEAERDGHVLRVLAEVDQPLAVGSVFLWLGDRADEAVPDPGISQPDAPAAAAGALPPTAKARALLRELHLDASVIPVSGARLTVADIEAYLARRDGPGPAALPALAPESLPEAPGDFEPLSPEARGMLATVLWHRDRAAHAYLELEYDPTPWEDHAKSYAASHRLMLSPLLPLLAYRLVEIVRAEPRLNATVVGDRCYRYRSINLGFTVQAERRLYLTVIRAAEGMSVEGFIDALGTAQRLALAHKLGPDRLTGATVAFSSMARWNVSRHIPLLPPHCSLMIAHAAPRGSGRAVLGASYDHRLLSGFDVIQVLQALAQTPD